MAQRPLTTFKKTCLAAAIAAIGAAPSACSTTPKSADDGFDGTLAGAGSTTREAADGTRAETGLWDRAMYLLGFGAEASKSRDGQPSDEQLLDEVDLALMEEDAVMPDPAHGAPTTAVDVVRSREWSEIADEEIAGAPDASASEASGGERTEGNARFVATSDLKYEVDEGETLWDIAKATTGDATNWHVLADVNDLAPDASVYPGQTLMIPADMIRPETSGVATGVEAGTDDGAPGAASSGEPAESAVTGVQIGDGRSATPSTGAAVVAEDAGLEDNRTEPDREFDIGPGETLWDFAKRVTGDATNWQAIADANGFGEREATRVREGQTIGVPRALLREASAGAPQTAEAVPATDPAGEDSEPSSASMDTETVAVATGTATDGGTPRPSEVEDTPVAARSGEMVPIADAPAPAADPAAAAVSDTIEGMQDSSELLANARSALDETATPSVRIVEATYRSGEEDSVIGAETAASAVAASLPSEIMVSGTYYPKAVYNDADFSSSLLMRVSPGTTLQVSRALGPWFEVETDQGTGYVHTRDIK